MPESPSFKFSLACSCYLGQGYCSKSEEGIITSHWECLLRSHNDYKSPEKASVDRVRGTKSVFESAIWIAINNEQQRVGRGREPTATLLHVETRSLMRGGGTQRVGRYRGCLNVWHTGNISLGFMNELLMAMAAAFLLHPESFLWTSPRWPRPLLASLLSWLD